MKHKILKIMHEKVSYKTLLRKILNYLSEKCGLIHPEATEVFYVNIHSSFIISPNRKPAKCSLTEWVKKKKKEWYIHTKEY